MFALVRKLVVFCVALSIGLIPTIIQAGIYKGGKTGYRIGKGSWHVARIEVGGGIIQIYDPSSDELIAEFNVRQMRNVTDQSYDEKPNFGKVLVGILVGLGSVWCFMESGAYAYLSEEGADDESDEVNYILVGASAVGMGISYALIGAKKREYYITLSNSSFGPNRIEARLNEGEIRRFISDVQQNRVDDLKKENQLDRFSFRIQPTHIDDLKKENQLDRFSFHIQPTHRHVFAVAQLKF